MTWVRVITYNIACPEVANKLRSFMRQTKSGLKSVINSFGEANHSFRRADELLSALYSQFNGQSVKKPLVAGSLVRTPRNPRKVTIRDQSWSSGRPQQILKCC